MQSYCNNCDKIGHTFHTCRKPIVSYGVIAFRKNPETSCIEYLSVCRKHTYGYIDFMRGKYSINNKEQIKDIIFEMTNKEKKNILESSFIQLWQELWGSANSPYFINEKIFASEKFKMLSRGIQINNDFYNTKQIIEESDTSWESPEWGFPKGRKNFKEIPRSCAIREWCEETGFSSQNIDIIDNIELLDEIVIGSNYQTYKDSYHIAGYVDIPINDSNTINFQKIEISDAGWFSYDELIKKIRPYHKERINIIKKIDSLLNKSSQYIYG